MSFDQWSPSFLKHMICKATGQSEPVANMRTSISNQITDRRNLKRRVGMPRNVSNEWGKRYFQIDVTYLDIIFLLSKQYHLLLLLLADTLTSLVNCSLPLRRDVPLTDVFLFLFTKNPPWIPQCVLHLFCFHTNLLVRLWKRSKDSTNLSTIRYNGVQYCALRKKNIHHHF